MPKPPEPNFVVQPTPSTYFTNRGNGSEEMKFGPVAGYGDTVPNDRFYIHSRAAAPKVDVGAWRLHVGGSAIKKARSFRHDELVALAPVTLRRTLDCGVNCRAFFPKVSPYASLKWLPVGWTQWHFGAVGAAEWKGVRVKDVLQAAGLGAAVDVRFTSLDSIVTDIGKLPYAQVVPLAKAIADDTLLVYEMNGQPLPIDHGYPLRVLFSGWGGNTAVKWLGSIEASSEPQPVSHFQINQVMDGPDYPEPMLGTVAPVRSALELNEDLTLQPGDHTLHGRAWSGAGAIDHVDVCIEQEVAPGRWTAIWDPPWRSAKLLHKPEPMMWVRFEVAWENAAPGRYRLMTRATDDAGRTQPRPEDVVWNQHGLGYGGHAPLELSVLPMTNFP
ncbi:molybdopterin-dependent oxidoreductase [Nannocystis sp. SCPEA4]|uniref:molybdopterin-dependent oxidoreductase n=1 Tax=Nannocystis sp. SCPEA4 TaxID=2996787 RepID=UPI002271B0E5|nr:molybdopterin-dependent oxidoreductase [Nannocystis sp. SCPEA4]MCY1059606.1 molybdopterin-dependent oxidoreductase [Nannocystis sp. SCPEA4]